MVRKVQKGETHADRAAQRQGLGPLRSLVVSRSALQAYEYAVGLLRTCVLMVLGTTVADDVARLDDQLVAFIETAWQEGEPLATMPFAACNTS